MSGKTYEGAPPPGGSGSEQRAITLTQPRRQESAEEAAERLLRSWTRVRKQIRARTGLMEIILCWSARSDRWRPHEVTRARVLMASRGHLADGPELFGDLRERERISERERESSGEHQAQPCADNGAAVEPARIWSNGEAKATVREDGALDLIVADGIADNRRYVLQRRAG